MNYDIINIFRGFTVFQILLVSMFLLLDAQRKSRKNLLLVLFIVSKAFFVSDILLISYHSSLPQSLLWLVCIGTSFQLFLGPAAYYIMVVITNNNFSFTRKHLLHAVPFVLYLGFIISQYHVRNTAEQLQMLNNWFPWSAPWSRAASAGFYLHFSIYGIAALRVLSQGRENLYAYTSQSVEHNIWFLKFLIYDFIIVWGINILSGYVQFGDMGRYILSCATAFNIFFIANTIVYQGLKFPAIFDNEASRPSKYEKNLLSYEEKNSYAKKIKEYMEFHKPFLNPSLSLSDLSEQVALPPYIVSQVLNMAMNQNFYDFINSFRVNESKKLMAEASNNEKTILEILHKSGFNSKSVFNSAFKKHAGMTPREYKKSFSSSHRQEIVSIAS
jgi:AraC-like DNA-binding protein